MATPLYKKSIVLLSGGLDSATTLALAKERSQTTLALSFDYGQRHHCELQAAGTIAESQAVSHRLLSVSLKEIGGSALTSTEIPVPGADVRDKTQKTIPVTYVPARNTIFLSYALALAEVEAADAIFIGINALDYSGYPDCRPEYLERFQALANLATRQAVEGAPVVIEAPLISLTKAEIITLGMAHGVDYSQTVSCYNPDANGAACGACDSCFLRRQGFEEAGIEDPTRYR